MEIIKSVRSPAFRDGVLSWCEGDKFSFKIRMRLSSLGEEIADLTGSVLSARFFDKSGKPVKTFTQSGDATCIFTLAFNTETTAIFPRGRYTFDIVIENSAGKCTVANDVPALVK